MADILETIKREMQTQREEQEGDLIDFDIESVKIGTFDNAVTKLLQEQSQLQSLSLVDCQLTSLEGLPNLPNLENLVLEANQLDGSAIKVIANTYPKLICLSLADNKIQNLNDLQPLTKLKRLQQLDLSDNPATSQKNYFSKVFEIIPTLKVLDNKDQDGNEIQYSDEDEENVEVGESDEDFDDGEIDDDDEDEDEVDESEPKPVKKNKK